MAETLLSPLHQAARAEGAIRQSVSPRFMTVAAVVGASLALAGAAFGSAGVNLYNPGSLQVNATRVNITRFTLLPPNNGNGSGDVNLAVRAVQCFSCGSNTPGVYQLGYIRIGNFGSDCGSGPTGVLVFAEFAMFDGPLHCLHANTANANDQFGVVQLSGQNGVWQGFQNSAKVFPAQSLLWNTGEAQTAGEYVGSKGTADGSFGASGTIVWQWSGDHGSSYTTIPTRSGVVNDNNEWSVQAPPSPFRIHD